MEIVIFIVLRILALVVYVLFHMMPVFLHLFTFGAWKLLFSSAEIVLRILARLLYTCFFI